MIKCFQIDSNIAIIKWDGLEDATTLAKIIRDNDIQIKTLYGEIKE